MAAQSIVTVDRSGTINPVTDGVQCAAGGDTFPNTGSQYVYWQNTSGGAITVSQVIQTTVDGEAVAAKTFSIAGGATIMTGPYPVGTYNDGNSNTNFTYSVNPPTGLKMTVLQNTTN